MEKKSEYTFTEPQLAHILALQQQGASLSEIAEEYQVSGQVICEEIKRARHFNEIPDVTMRIYFMNREELCTAIDIDFRHERVKIRNSTDQIPLRAFGVVTEPDWKDFEYFLEERCFPKTRDHAKEILKELGLPFYDPLLIVEKTKGYMAGDQQWLLILKKEA